MTPTGRQETQPKLHNIPLPTTKIGQELKKSFVTPIEFPDVDYTLLEAHLVMENFSKICSLPNEVYLRREVPEEKNGGPSPKKEESLSGSSPVERSTVGGQQMSPVGSILLQSE